MPERTIASEWGAITATVLALLPAPLLARLLYHRRLVRLGKRRMWSWELAWEPPTAALCAILAGGIGEYFTLGFVATHAIAGVVGWLGPRGLEIVAARYFGAESTGEPRNTPTEDR